MVGGKHGNHSSSSVKKLKQRSLRFLSEKKSIFTHLSAVQQTLLIRQKPYSEPDSNFIIFVDLWGGRELKEQLKGKSSEPPILLAAGWVAPGMLLEDIRSSESLLLKAGHGKRIGNFTCSLTEPPSACLSSEIAWISLLILH